MYLTKKKTLHATKKYAILLTRFLGDSLHFGPLELINACSTHRSAVKDVANPCFSLFTYSTYTLLCLCAHHFSRSYMTISRKAYPPESDSHCINFKMSLAKKINRFFIRTWSDGLTTVSLHLIVRWLLFIRMWGLHIYLQCVRCYLLSMDWLVKIYGHFIQKERTDKLTTPAKYRFPFKFQ